MLILSESAENCRQLPKALEPPRGTIKSKKGLDYQGLFYCLKKNHGEPYTRRHTLAQSISDAGNRPEAITQKPAKAQRFHALAGVGICAKVSVESSHCVCMGRRKS